VTYLSRLRLLLIYWLPVLVMMGIISYSSTDQFSSEHTQGALERLLHWLIPGLTEQTLLYTNLVIRKLSHFFAYALLALLLFRAFRADSPMRWRSAWAAYSLAVCIAWAMLDELHQAFTYTRHSALGDVLLDSVGGLSMLIILGLHYRKATSSTC